MGPSAKDKFVAYIDTQLDKSKIGRFGQENRVARQDAFQAKFEGSMATDTAGKESTTRSALNGNTQLIGERPTVDVDKLTPDDQAKYFETNSVTKSEGTLVERLKKGFEVVAAKFKEKLVKAEVDPEKFKVDGLEKIGAAGTPVKFEKKDYFDNAKIKDLASLDPKKQESITTVAGITNIENATRKNVDKLIEGLYGTTFNYNLNRILNDRLDSHGKLAGEPTFDLNNHIGQIVGGSGLGIPIDSIQSLELLSQAVKVSLLQNPDKAKSIIASIDAGTTNITDIEGLEENIKLACVKFIADEYSKNKKDFFTVAGSVTQAEVNENRKHLVEALLNGLPAGGLKLTGTGLIDFDVTGLVNITTLAAYSSIDSDKIGTKSTVTPEKMSSFKNNIYQGLFKGTTGDTLKVLKAASRAMSEGNSKDIFEKVFVNGIAVATNKTNTDIERLKAYAKMENYLANASTTASATLKPKLEAMRKSLVEYSSPEGITVGIEKDIMFGLADKLAAITPPITGFHQSELKLSIEKALKSNPANKEIVDRLVMMGLNITDKDQRKEFNDGLRAVANLEILREVAAQLAGDATNDKYKQNLFVLLNKFAIEGNNPEDLAKDLLNVLYAKPNSEKALDLAIDGNANLKAYLQGLLGAGATLQPKLELNGQASGGKIYSRAHELLGIVRKGVEAGEWRDLSTASDDDIKKYLTENFGIKEDSTKLDEILTRFKAVSTSTTGVFELSTVISKATSGEGTEYGADYTNLLRIFRSYIVNGGDFEKTLKDFEKDSVTGFVESIQKQANDQLGSKAGDAMTDKNRVLSVEEQRATVLQNYEDLSGAKGLKGFFKRMVAAVPRIMKSFGVIALATAAAAFPLTAGPAALLLVGLRVFSVAKTLQTGIPMIKDMWNRGDSKMAWAMAAGVGVNVLVNSLVPTPWGMGLTLIGETVGSELFAMKSMKKEAKLVVDAHAKYESTVDTYMGSLSLPNDEETVRRIAKSINATIATTATGGMDLPNTLVNIKASRTAARDPKNPNITLLRGYSKVIEELQATEVDKIRKANAKARDLHEDTQRTLMAYAVASSATKLYFGISRGAAAGWNDGEGGIVGAALGAVGIADYKTLLDFNGNDESANSSELPTQSELTEIQTNLENQFDQFTASYGLTTDSDNVLGIAQAGDGTVYALVDLDGDPNTVEGFIPLDQNGNLDFSKVDFTITYAETGGGETRTGLEAYSATAESGDSQWTLVEDTLRQAYPSASDQQIWTATANIINEATPGGVYEQVYDNRVGGGGGAVRIGDTLTLQDISEMAPNQFERLENNVERVGASNSGTVASATDEGDELVFPSEVPANITGALIFESQQGVIGGGNLAFLSQFGVSDDGTGGGSTTTQTSTNATTDDKPVINWRELFLGKPAGAETGGGNVASESGSTYESFTIKDPGLGSEYTIDESKVQQIVVHGKFESMPDTIIDPSKVDVIEVTKNGVTYLDEGGKEVFVPNERGDIAFKFVGVDQPVSFSEGTDNILDAVNNLAQTVAQTGQEIANQTGDFASTVSVASDAAEEMKVSVDQVVSGLNELKEDISAINYAQGAYYDGDYNGNPDFPITNSGLRPDGTGLEYTATVAGPSTIAGTNAYIEMMSIDQANGTKFTVSLDQVVKVGADYITYLDPQTNEAVTVNGTNLVGVGASYSTDPSTGAHTKLDPYQFEFSPTGVTTATPVENPWWDFSSIVIDNVPAKP